MGGTGNLPVPPGHWPGGRESGSNWTRTLEMFGPHSHSARQVAARHRRVACATQIAGQIRPRAPDEIQHARPFDRAVS